MGPIKLLGLIFTCIAQVVEKTCGIIMTSLGTTERIANELDREVQGYCDQRAVERTRDLAALKKAA